MLAYLVFGLLAFVFFGLVTYGVKAFADAKGSVLDRLAAAWGGSLTIFVLAWGALATLSLDGLDLLSEFSGDEQFSALANAVTSVIPPTWRPYVPVVVMAIGIAARLRPAKGK